jgi:hypothetical protein
MKVTKTSKFVMTVMVILFTICQVVASNDNTSQIIKQKELPGQKKINGE